MSIQIILNKDLLPDVGAEGFYGQESLREIGNNLFLFSVRRTGIEDLGIQAGINFLYY
ncbi:MAG: hypothetical protein GPJ54_12755 [Candidatus Heimdallarchaeota archaeon]|nr:hypothetical protein [Candidatus Heimdallarchaeota archaeon]